VTLAELTLATLLLGLAAYVVLAGADFGAGFWDLTAGGSNKGSRIRTQIKRSMAPVWEANHVWLIFVLVVFWTGFPTAFGAVMRTLYVPLFLAAIGIIFRGVSFAFRGEAAGPLERRILGITFALSSFLVPFFLGAAVGGVASGQVPARGTGDAIASWTNPTSLLVGALGVATGIYLAAVYLAADSARKGLPDLVTAFRRRAIGAGVVTGAIALGGLVVVRADARPLFDGLTSGAGLAMACASAAAASITFALVWCKRLELARVSAAGAVAALVAGWAAAQSPDLLPGQLTVQQAAAGHSTLVALLASLGVGFLFLGPSLALLFRLMLRGYLDPTPAKAQPGEPPEAERS